jgi:hypothetical protein
LTLHADAEIPRLHVVIGLELVGAALEHHGPVLEHVTDVREPDRERVVLLDEQQ